MKTYSELKQLKTFRDRYNYLRISGKVGVETFGFDRYLNQALYTSPDWKRVRDYVIARDNGCDLGIPGREINSRAIIHHMNPITESQILHRDPDIFNPEYLITTTHKTHNAIHYGSEDLLEGISEFVERTPNDTCLWR